MTDEQKKLYDDIQSMIDYHLCEARKLQEKQRQISPISPRQQRWNEYILREQGDNNNAHE